MRHRKKNNHLSRTSSHRRAMLSNMATSLILHKRITTTLAKAKALRSYVEPIITRSKEDTTHSRRMVFSYLQSKDAVTELFREISTKVAERPGGYTRIVKMGNRLGDNADMCLIELVDYNDLYTAKEAPAAKETSRRRRRRGSGSSTVTETAAETPKETVVKAEETPADQEPETIKAEQEPVSQEPTATAENEEQVEEVTDKTETSESNDEKKEEQDKPEADSGEETKKSN
jgi:large subunit ribosomal protein L17